MQRLPQLNTEGVNVTNTLQSIANQKRLDAEEARRAEKFKMEKFAFDQLNSPVVREKENNILKFKEQAAKLEQQTALYNRASQGMIAAIAATEAGDTEAYGRYRDYAVNELGIDERNLPKESFFYDTKEDQTSPNKTTEAFNSDRFLKYGRYTIASAADIFKLGEKAGEYYTQETVYGPDGQVGKINVKRGADIFPEKLLGKGWSFTPPKEKEYKAPTKLTRQVGDEIVTEYFNPTTGQTEEVGRGPKFAPKETAEAQAKVNRPMQNSKGETVILMTDGSVWVPGVDGKPVKATGDQVIGLKNLEGPVSPIVEALLATMSGSQETTPTEKAPSIGDNIAKGVSKIKQNITGKQSKKLPVISTQEAYDKLKPGDHYIEDGNEFIKP